MISNEVYDELKKRKGSRSFSETIKESLADRKEKTKTMKELFDRCYGLLKDDTEYGDLMKEAKKKWKEFDEQIRKSSA